MFKYFHSLREELPLRKSDTWSHIDRCALLWVGAMFCPPHLSGDKTPTDRPCSWEAQPWRFTETNAQTYKLMPEARFKANTRKVNTTENGGGSAQRHFHKGWGANRGMMPNDVGGHGERSLILLASVAIGQGRRGCRLLLRATLPLDLDQSLLSFMPTWLEPSWHACVVMWLRSCQLISCGQKRPVLLFMRSATCFPVSASPVALAAITIRLESQPRAPTARSNPGVWWATRQNLLWNTHFP